jgi:hypothetical protein
MKLETFRLDRWIDRFKFAIPPIAYDLGSSAGPPWTLDQLVAIDDGLHERLYRTELSYAHSRDSGG